VYTRLLIYSYKLVEWSNMSLRSVVKARRWRGSETCESQGPMATGLESQGQFQSCFGHSSGTATPRPVRGEGGSQRREAGGESEPVKVSCPECSPARLRLMWIVGFALPCSSTSCSFTASRNPTEQEGR